MPSHKILISGKLIVAMSLDTALRAAKCPNSTSRSTSRIQVRRATGIDQHVGHFQLKEDKILFSVERLRQNVPFLQKRKKLSGLIE